MRALDTNVLARLVAGDDAVQTGVATAVLREPCFISDTVLLETARLLSSRYRMDRADLAATFLDLLRLPSVTVSDPAMLEWAIGAVCGRS